MKITITDSISSINYEVNNYREMINFIKILDKHSYYDENFKHDD